MVGERVSQATTPEFDYEQMDFVTGQPYPIWAEARRECPVFRSHNGPTGFTERPIPRQVVVFQSPDPVRDRAVEGTYSIDHHHVVDFSDLSQRSRRRRVAS